MPQVSEIIIQSVRAVVLIGLPFLVAFIIAAILTSLIQSVTTIREPVIGFALRLFACIAVLYMFLPRFTSVLVSLSQIAYR